MPILSSDLVKRKKEDVYAEGYVINVATEVLGATSATETVTHLFGQDSVLTDITVDNGTLSLTVFDKKDDNKILDILNEEDPDLTDSQRVQYNWEDVIETTVWTNRKNKNNDQYMRSAFYKDWLPVPGMDVGGPSERGMRTFTGNCDVPKEFNEPIFGEKLVVTSGASGYTTSGLSALSYTPLEVPTNTGLYALRVVAIEEERDATTSMITKFNREELDVDAGMVSSVGAVVIAQSDLSVIGGPNRVFVNYLYDKTIGIKSSTTSGAGMAKKL